MRRWQTIVAMFTSASLAGCVYLTIEYKEAAAPSDPFALKISHGDPIGRVIGEEPPHLEGHRSRAGSERGVPSPLQQPPLIAEAYRPLLFKRGRNIKIIAR